ncbi:MAG: HEPN domain protein [Pelotomaculum sp. PtaU1.Bin035]|nr:MAG: HEPN domain protein [Pelotomaculum sp. PtaU1.Bin035]
METAEIMWKSTRYVYTVFMCHLAIEKALKALFAESTGTIPPRIHNLIKLAKITQANLNEDQTEFISIPNFLLELMILPGVNLKVSAGSRGI